LPRQGADIIDNLVRDFLGSFSHRRQNRFAMFEGRALDCVDDAIRRKPPERPGKFDGFREADSVAGQIAQALGQSRCPDVEAFDGSGEAPLLQASINQAADAVSR
jgi:hypothetical protein